MRPRIFLFGLAAVIILALVLLSLADSLLVDLLWFSTLGYRQVFIITLGAQVAIFAIVWAVAFLAIWISGMIALRLSRERGRLHVVGRSRRDGRGQSARADSRARRPCAVEITFAGRRRDPCAVCGQGEASSWDVYLKALYGVPFGLKEPAFGLDVGFYVFTLPLLEELRDLFMTDSRC